MDKPHDKKRRTHKKVRHNKNENFTVKVVIYFVTLSSHFTIPSITPIDIRQTIRNTNQQY